MITLYDIDGKPSAKDWSLNVWKTRYTLNLKKLPYKTTRLEYPDIESNHRAVGIPPSDTWSATGAPYFSCPAIVDDTTGAVLTDSYKIAEYLDKQYPDTPKAIPPGTEVFHAAFYSQFSPLLAPIRPLILPRVPAILNPPSEEYFIRSRAVMLGKPLSEVELVGEARAENWAKAKANFGTIDGWLSKSPGPFFGGKTPVFADFMVGGVLVWIKKVFGESSQEWKDIEEWHNGRWKDMLVKLEPYVGTG